MPKAEDDRHKIVAHLEKDGWKNIGGANHDVFIKPGLRPIQVPRHRTVSPGVARMIAKAAGWQ